MADSSATAPPALDTVDATVLISLNIGGELFQTTLSTLLRAGSTSPLSSLRPPSAFLDRDPAAFALLLSFLRSGRVPSSPHRLAALRAEAAHFGVSPLPFPTRPFHPLSLSPSLSLPLPGRAAATSLSFSVSPAPALFASHGALISRFDAPCFRRSTALTPIPAIDSLAAVSDDLVVAGAADYPGLHLLAFRDDGAPASPVAVLDWSSGAGSLPATVQAIAAAPARLFASYESPRRNASAIVAFDVETLTAVAEIGRKEVFGADIESAIPASRLCWINGAGLLLAAGSHSGPAGLVSDIRLWDIRISTATPVWELREKHDDCFADVAASDELAAVFKVTACSGEVFMADLRTVGSPQPWTCIGEGPAKAAPGGRREGSGCRVACYGRSAMVTRGEEVEVWMEVVMAEDSKRLMRRNRIAGPLSGKGEAEKTAKKITGIALGGSRMAVAREGECCVEMWDSTASC